MDVREKLKILIAKRISNCDHLRNIFITDDEARTAFWLNIRQIQNMDIQEHYRTNKSTLKEWYIENTRICLGLCTLIERKNDIFLIRDYLSILAAELNPSPPPPPAEEESQAAKGVEESYYLNEPYSFNSFGSEVYDFHPTFDFDPQEIVLTICDVLKELYKSFESITSYSDSEIRPYIKAVAQIDKFLFEHFIDKIYTDMSNMAFTVIRSNINSIDAIYALNKIRHAMR